MFEVSGNTCNNAFQLGMQECCVANCSNLLLVLLHLKVQQIDATLSHCKLKSRCCTYKITTHPKHCHATQFRCCKLKQHVAASLNWCHLATTTFCCVTMQFEVGGNTCNFSTQYFSTCNATMLYCKLKKNVAHITGPLRRLKH